MSQITPLNTHEIIPGNNDRTVFDPGQLQELANSIREHGLIQPISVRFLEDCDLYQIIAGERRWRACKLAGMTEVPAIILDVDDEEASVLMLAENVARADLDPVDEGNAYASRMARFGWSVKECAQNAGVSEVRVRFRLKLLKLRDDLQKLVRDGQLPIGYAQILADANLDNNRQLIAIARLRSNPSPTPSWFRREVGALLTEQSQESLFDTSIFVVQQAPNEAPAFVEPPHPATTAPPKADNLIDTLRRQVQFWTQAARDWDALGKPFKRQECEAAAQALNLALAAI